MSSTLKGWSRASGRPEGLGRARRPRTPREPRRPAARRVTGGPAHDPRHLLLDAREVGVGDRFGELEVVVEAVLDGRADGVLGARKEADDRLRHDVRGGVAQDLEGDGVVACERDDGERVAVLEYVREVDEAAVVTRPAIAAFASRGPIAAAASATVAPSSSSSGEPSGRVTCRVIGRSFRDARPRTLRGLLTRESSRETLTGRPAQEPAEGGTAVIRSPAGERDALGTERPAAGNAQAVPARCHARWEDPRLTTGREKAADHRDRGSPRLQAHRLRDQ